MRVLGVDPGLTRCGLGVIDAGTSRSVSLVDVSVARAATDLAPEERLGAIADAVTQAFSVHAPDVVAIERVFAQHNVRTVMGTAQVSGVVMYLARQQGIPVAMYTPSEVKAAVTGSGRADKKQVGFMVARILGVPEVPGPADAADSLAIAIAHAWRGATVVNAGRQPTAAQRQWAAAAAAAQTGSAGRGRGVSPTPRDPHTS